MSYRFRDPSPVFLGLLGTAPIPGGKVQFYDRGTTTEKDTYGDAALTTPNANPVPLDASGRFTTEVWLDGEYTVVVYDVDDTVVVAATDILPEVSAATAVPDPTGQTGKVLVSDGVAYVFEDRLQFPDPTGSAGYVVTADPTGTFYILSPPPDPPPASDITIAANRIVFKSSDNTKAWQVLKGTATIPASGANTASLPITFANAFKAGEVPNVTITPAPGTQPGGPVVPYLSAAPTASGFTAVVDVAEGNSVNQNITVAAVVQWCAQGEIDP